MIIFYDQNFIQFNVWMPFRSDFMQMEMTGGEKLEWRLAIFAPLDKLSQFIISSKEQNLGTEV